MTNQRAMQILLVALILVSTTMLSVSINHYYLIPFAFVASVGAFFLTDLLEWLSIEGWIANSISVGILAWSLFEFYPADSSGKLIAVARMLVFLQAVLVFQRKTPRLNWQIMVLSLLQLVITTIFSIEFEGSVLFFVFFAVGGVALIVQNSFACEYAIEQRNEASLDVQRKNKVENSKTRRLAFWRYDSRPQPTVTSLSVLQKLRLRPLAIFPGVAMVAAMFTSILFLTAPRNVDPWFSPITIKVSSTGISQQVELEETGRIENSNRRLFEASFKPLPISSSGPQLQLTELPYFRGIALSNLTYKDGKTKWNAAYERVHSGTYQSIPTLPAHRHAKQAIMSVTMEKTTEPLLYTMMPTGLAEDSKLLFCHELSAYARCRENEEIDFAPFDYKLMVALSDTNTPAVAWPYFANTPNLSVRPMALDPSQTRWLTRINRSYYPTLVGVADRIASQVRDNGGGRAKLVAAIEAYFLDSTRFKYTMDYTDVDRNLDIDPNEDFIANFRTGHCVAFASAMTLMLRSQGIPARMVTGFHGGDFVESSRSYVVRERDAHAWVEVYLRKEDCKEAKLEGWQYSQGGAWLRADPTPPQPVSDEGFGTEGAIELARTVWQDYVLGMEADKQSNQQSTFAASIVSFFRDFDVQRLSQNISASSEHGWISIMRPLVVVLLIVAAIIGLLRILILNAGYEEEQPDTTVGKIKRFFADAIGLISTDLREWVIGHESETAFYKKLTEILETHDFVRDQTQTHREFAEDVVSRLSTHPSFDLISNVIDEVTVAFNRVRFGLEEIDVEERSRLDNDIDELEKALKVKTA